MRLFLLFIFTFLFFNSFAQKEFQIDTFNLNVNSNFRGLSVVNDDIIWISGSNGFVGVSTDGGKHFNINQIMGFEKFDFRDIEAFNEKDAVVINAGSPAYILKTKDGGNTWKVSYTNPIKEIFFNGMDFWDDKKGIAFSDPVENKLFIIKTEDGGKSWKEIPYKDCPLLQDGEAGFAASGTSIRVTGDGYAFIGTGGKAAHLFTSVDYGKTWKKFSCPIIKFKESTGIFSVAFRDARTGMVIGGDYAADSVSKDNFFLTFNGGKSWKLPFQSPGGYRSCVEYITQTHLIATGTSGTDISYDGGQTWLKFSPLGFNTVRRAKKTKKVFLAGNNGLIGVLK